MTHAPRAAPVAVHDVADAVAVLRARGGRLTSARRALLEALFGADGAASAELLARGTGIDLATAYRTLEHLEGLGVVRHVHIGHGPGLYALARSPEREYLACERCHSVTMVDASALDGVRADIRDAFGYEARFSHFPIVGLCAACAAGGGGGAEAPGHSHGDRLHAHGGGHAHRHDD
jgi:Fur family ferric uptake transcriptional regulator